LPGRIRALGSIFALAGFIGVCRAQDDSGASSDNAFTRDLWLSGQANIITQGHPAFDSPYSGPNSFSAEGEIATSRVLTLYTGFRFTETTDFLLDVEETSGRNLSGSHGLASFPNVDLAGVPNATPSGQSNAAPRIPPECGRNGHRTRTAADGR
jgi:hypothetical protein